MHIKSDGVFIQINTKLQLLFTHVRSILNNDISHIPNTIWWYNHKQTVKTRNTTLNNDNSEHDNTHTLQ